MSAYILTNPIVLYSSSPSACSSEHEKVEAKSEKDGIESPLFEESTLPAAQPMVPNAHESIAESFARAGRIFEAARSQRKERAKTVASTSVWETSAPATSRALVTRGTTVPLSLHSAKDQEHGAHHGATSPAPATNQKRPAPEDDLEPLPNSSRDVALIRPCCERCCQYIANAKFDICDMTSTAKCSRCRKMKARCSEISSKYVDQVNDLIKEADALPEGECASKQLQQRVAAINAAIRADNRKETKRGGTRKSQSSVDTMTIAREEEERDGITKQQSSADPTMEIAMLDDNRKGAKRGGTRRPQGSVNPMMEVAMRADNPIVQKRRGTRTPKHSMEAKLQEIATQLKRHNYISLFILDSFRAVHGLPPLAYPDEDEDEDEEEGENEDEDVE